MKQAIIGYVTSDEDEGLRHLQFQVFSVCPSFLHFSLKTSTSWWVWLYNELWALSVVPYGIFFSIIWLGFLISCWTCSKRDFNVCFLHNTKKISPYLSKRSIFKSKVKISLWQSRHWHTLSHTTDTKYWTISGSCKWGICTNRNSYPPLRDSSVWRPGGHCLSPHLRASSFWFRQSVCQGDGILTSEVRYSSKPKDCPGKPNTQTPSVLYSRGL